jgi:hypothetical protein
MDMAVDETREDRQITEVVVRRTITDLDDHPVFVADCRRPDLVAEDDTTAAQRRHGPQPTRRRVVRRFIVACTG